MNARTRRSVYPSDLSDAEWQQIEPFMPSAFTGGRQRDTDLRAVVDAILYLVRSGCTWRMLPKDFPHHSTVYEYFSRWRKDGTLTKIHDALRNEVRAQAGKQAEPTAAILDSQSVKTTEVAGVRGYDGGKKIKGRKRHLLVDTMGLLLVIVVHSAGIQDRDGAKLVLERAKRLFPGLRRIWADGGYSGKLVEWAKSIWQWVLEIVKRPAEAQGFVLLPRRWVVERTFGWFGRYRRLSKDYEVHTETSEAMIQWAMIYLMINRVCRTPRKYRAIQLEF